MSGYDRKPDESYYTIVWPILATLPQLGRIRRAWDCCDSGNGTIVRTLRDLSIVAVGSGDDFLLRTEAPPDVDLLLTNPPYGEKKRGELAVAFIEHALKLGVPRVAMLLRNDFDSAKSRQHLFRSCPSFAFKLVLLDRIKWFAGPSSPSDNHAFYVWDHAHRGPPSIRYVTRAEAIEYRATQRYATGVPSTMEGGRCATLHT